MTFSPCFPPRGQLFPPAAIQGAPGCWVKKWVGRVPGELEKGVRGGFWGFGGGHLWGFWVVKGVHVGFFWG